MKTHIKDGLQVMAALLLTGSVASAMAPPPIQKTVSTKNTAIVKTVSNPAQKVVSAPVQPQAPVAPTVTWQDNPNHCDQNSQYIASTAPFACIDKPQPVSAPKAAPAAPPQATAPQVTGNYAKDYIYAHESGNNPSATNSLGCYGLGQDCNGVVRSQCGADWACQDEYFSGYAMRRYGSWEAAYNFWVNNHWW